jgi:hypothetical protein
MPPAIDGESYTMSTMNCTDSFNALKEGLGGEIRRLTPPPNTLYSGH